MTGALDGIRVIDCTHFIAGPWCSMILADLGADVIKLEGARVDISRLPVNANGFNSFPYVNRNKRGLALDLSKPEARDALRRLAMTADVLVENYRPGALDRMGLSYTELSELNPRLIYCSVSGFGTSGPYRERGGLDLVAQAMSGLMSLNGEPDGHPLPHAAPITDINAGLYAAVGVLAALRDRERTGKGQHVETSLFESGFVYTLMQLGQYLSDGDIVPRMGGSNAYAAPYGPFAAQDGDLVIAAGSPDLWRRTAEVLDDPTLQEDHRFSGMGERVANADALRAKMEAILATDSVANWLAKLQAAGVPAGPINTVAHAVADPQLEHLGALVQCEGARYFRTPIDMDRTPVSISRGPPAHGEHTAKVLEEAGYGAAEIEELFANGAALRSPGPA
jgi:crotonobetainyl-CoA:carnitine CoA-transferase CaiB-like acyl-CoA transferase